MSNKKEYTAEEVAKAVLEKAHEMLNKSDLFKANNSHEVETGEEPSNDDAEAPEYLANADIEDDGKDDEKRRKSTASDGKSAAPSKKHDKEPEHEMDMSEEEETAHDAEENEDDEKDEDKIEADEEDVANDKDAKEIIDAAASDNDKEKKKFPFEKTEKGLGKLKKFLEIREEKLEKSLPTRMATPQESSSVADRMKYKRMATPQEKIGLEDKKKLKNKKMEKFLGVSEKQKKDKAQAPMKPQAPQEPKGSGMKGY